MKTAGIVCDDYKVARFEKMLNKAGYDFISKPYLPGTTIIKVSYANQEEQRHIGKICNEVELYFKRSN